MAASTLSLGKLHSFAFCSNNAKRKFVCKSDPPCLTAVVISNDSFWNLLARALSTRAFLCLIFSQCECPASKIERDFGSGDHCTKKLNKMQIIFR